MTGKVGEVPLCLNKISPLSSVFRIKQCWAFTIGSTLWNQMSALWNGTLIKEEHTSGRINNFSWKLELLESLISILTIFPLYHVLRILKEIYKLSKHSLGKVSLPRQFTFWEFIRVRQLALSIPGQLPCVRIPTILWSNIKHNAKGVIRSSDNLIKGRLISLSLHKFTSKG